MAYSSKCNSDLETNIKKVFVQPGNIYVNKKHFSAITVLGPCISVCLWDEEKQIGGMNHFMMPFWKGEGLATPKFGNIAIARLVEKFQNAGANKDSTIAKVFGGIKNNFSSKVFQVGVRNAEIAVDLLDKEGIGIAAMDVGGELGRKIIFDSKTGKVKVKYIKLNSNALRQ